MAGLVYLILCTLFALIVGGVAAARRRAEQELRQARGRALTPKCWNGPPTYSEARPIWLKRRA